MKAICRYFFIDIDTGRETSSVPDIICIYTSHNQVHFRTVLIFRKLPACHLKHDSIFHRCGNVMFLKAVSKSLEHSDNRLLKCPLLCFFFGLRVYVPVNNLFSHVGTFPGLNQY